MTTVIEAVFENGVFRPLVEVDFKENHRYKLIVENPVTETVDLAASGVDQQQVTELRARLRIFAVDWESEEMGDYDAARSRL
jgi:predicted DNA-binding antitoxin AbrB/MazE fold protein